MGISRYAFTRPNIRVRKGLPQVTVLMMNNQSREPVCRSLFGPVDHDQLRLDFQLHLKEMSEQDTRRWNFSFQSNAPLHGRFQWEEMSSACTVSFYQESKQLRISAGRPRTEEDESLSNEEKHICKNQENCSSISNKPTSLTEGRFSDNCISFHRNTACSIFPHNTFLIARRHKTLIHLIYFLIILNTSKPLFTCRTIIASEVFPPNNTECE
uniref:Cyclin-dependent kinase inhibitor domain-containing protein n=1 Tax=Nothobranchius furzeri TaxID=105023 RepID=A0A8C6NRH3_NOTFU